jgi:hypothetical protein
MYQSGVGVPDNFEANNQHTFAATIGTAVGQFDAVKSHVLPLIRCHTSEWNSCQDPGRL